MDALAALARHQALVLWSPAPDLQLAFEAGVIAPDLPERPPMTAANVRRGIWRSYGGVVVMHNGPLTDEKREWVAVLRSGFGALLAAASAMRRNRVQMDAPPRPQILIPWARTAPGCLRRTYAGPACSRGRTSTRRGSLRSSGCHGQRSTPRASPGGPTTYERCCAHPSSSVVLEPTICARSSCVSDRSPGEASCCARSMTSGSVRTASTSCASRGHC